MRNMFTILTCTYNRAHTLERVYSSLINQTKKNFEWLIIDDGSKDNTKKIVFSWKQQNLIKINYYYKENVIKFSFNDRNKI